MRDIPQLPSTDQINDPQARMFCDTLLNAWMVRNGDVGDGSKRFVTAEEAANVSAKVIYAAFGGVAGVGTGFDGGFAPGGDSNADLNFAGSQAIFNSELFRRLGERIATAIIPRDLVSWVTGEVQAQARSTTSLGARVAGAEAAVVNQQEFIATSFKASADAVNTIWALVGDPGQHALSLSQDGTHLESTIQTTDAHNWHQLHSDVYTPNGEVLAATVQQDFHTYASATDSKLESTYTLRVELRPAGKPAVIGGFGIMGSSSSAQQTTIDFGVRADRFWIAPPSSDPQLSAIPDTLPFFVDSLGVHIKTALISAASIDIAQIKRIIFSDTWNGDADRNTGTILKPGTQGWAISRNGNAEFHNVTVQGTIFADTGHVNRLIVDSAKEGQVTVKNNDPTGQRVTHNENRAVMVTLWPISGGGSNPIPYISAMDLNGFTINTHFDSGDTVVGWRYW